MAKKVFVRTVDWPKVDDGLGPVVTPSAILFRLASTTPEYVYFQGKTFPVVCRLPKKGEVRLCIRNRGAQGMVTRDVPEGETSTAGMVGDMKTVGFHPNHL